MVKTIDISVLRPSEIPDLEILGTIEARAPLEKRTVNNVNLVYPTFDKELLSKRLPGTTHLFIDYPQSSRGIAKAICCSKSFKNEDLTDRLYSQSITGAGFKEGNNLVFINNTTYFRLENLEDLDYDSALNLLKEELLKKGGDSFEVPDNKDLVGICGFGFEVYDNDNYFPHEAKADLYAILEEK